MSSSPRFATDAERDAYARGLRSLAYWASNKAQRMRFDRDGECSGLRCAAIEALHRARQVEKGGKRGWTQARDRSGRGASEGVAGRIGVLHAGGGPEPDLRVAPYGPLDAGDPQAGANGGW